ncbi:MAG: glycosyltransferase [Clostridia bacterium]|nr:glycosyltransferase [Clostridia bacterium]
MELSLCMIVKNEEKSLGACLESVKDAVDEIVIVDTGSSDGTKAVAARYTDRVLDVTWTDDFSAARNASMEAATKPFILWLDADDVLDPPESEKLAALKARLGDHVDAVMMPYHYGFSPDGSPALVFDRERIVRRAAGFAFEGAVHEVMAVSGHVIREEIIVRHTGSHGESSNRRNLAIYRRLLERGTPMTARDWYYYARELKSAGEYAEALNAFDRFLAMDGWLENRLDAQIGKGECHRALGDGHAAKAAYFTAMAQGTPRAEALCAMGECLLEEGNLPAAAFWYRAALQCDLPADPRAFVFPDAYGYVPLMQLCVIYDRLGDSARASRMNEQALLLHPGDAAALSNRAYFAQRLKE